MEEKEAKVFKFRDIFRSWSMTFRIHRIVISAIAFIIAALVFYLLFSIKPSFDFWDIIGFVIALFIIFIARILIAHSIRLEEIDDELFIDWKMLGKFLAKNLKSIIMFIIGWIIVFVLLGLGQLFFYVIGAIPYVGSFWLSVMYFIPYFISVFAVLSGVVIILGMPMMAPVIGVEQKGAMDTIIDLYHLVKDKALYIIGSRALMVIIGAVATGFVMFVIRASITLTNYGAALIMGKEFTKIHLPKFFLFLHYIFGYPLGLDIEKIATSFSSGYYSIPGFILGLFFIFISAVAISYFFLFITTSDTLIYLSTQGKYYPREGEEKEEAEEKKEEQEKKETEGDEKLENK